MADRSRLPPTSRPRSIPGRPPSPARLGPPYGSPPSPFQGQAASRTIYRVSAPGGIGSAAFAGGGTVHDRFGRRLSSSSWYSIPIGAASPPVAQSPPSRGPLLPLIQTDVHRVPSSRRLSTPSSSTAGTSAASRRRSLVGVQLPALPAIITARRLSNAGSAGAAADRRNFGEQRRSEDLPMSPPPLDSEQRTRRAKTPPDCCSVCAALSTPEWRKGPAGNRSLCNGCGLVHARRAKEREMMGEPAPATVAEIEAELVAIGEERFKPNGKYQLPRGTKQRILDTQARTRAATVGSGPAAQQQPRRARSRSTKLAGEEKAAVGALVELRRASISSTASAQYQSAMAPRSPPASTRGRRSGSLVGEGSYFPSNIGTNGGTGLPPSSSYMLPSPTFSFGRPPSPNTTAPRPSSRRLSHDVGPGPLTIAPGRAAKTHAPSARPAPPAWPMSALAAWTDRMSIAHLTAPAPRPSSPQRWEAPPPSASRLEHATSALRRQSSSIVGVLPPAAVPRPQTPVLSRRTTS